MSCAGAFLVGNELRPFLLDVRGRKGLLGQLGEFSGLGQAMTGNSADRGQG